MYFECFARYNMNFQSRQRVVPKPIRSMSYSVAHFELARLFKIGSYVWLPKSKERLRKLKWMCLAIASLSVFIPQWLHEAHGLSFFPGHWIIHFYCKHIIGRTVKLRHFAETLQFWWQGAWSDCSTMSPTFPLVLFIMKGWTDAACLILHRSERNEALGQ